MQTDFWYEWDFLKSIHSRPEEKRSGIRQPIIYFHDHRLQKMSRKNKSDAPRMGTSDNAWQICFQFLLDVAVLLSAAKKAAPA